MVHRVNFLFGFFLALLPLHAQDMTLDEVISEARVRSVAALSAKSSFVSDYWAWRAYQASRLPSLHLYGELGSFDRSLRLLQNYETGEMLYTKNYNMQNSVGLQLRQNIPFTGGTLYLYSDLRRIDQFGSSSENTWYAQPVTVSYRQPLFAYNQFKWDKLISPKEYEKAKRTYLESMESVTVRAVDMFYRVMTARQVYESSRTNYENTSRMLRVAADRMAIGSVTRSDYLQLELRMLNDSISINENLVKLNEARMSLNSLLGFDESRKVNPVLEETLPDIEMDYAMVLDKSSSNHRHAQRGGGRGAGQGQPRHHDGAQRPLRSLQLCLRAARHIPQPSRPGGRRAHILYPDIRLGRGQGQGDEGRGGGRCGQGAGGAGRERQTHQSLHGRGAVQQPAPPVRRVPPREGDSRRALRARDGEVPQRQGHGDGSQHGAHGERLRGEQIHPGYMQLLELLLHIA